MTYLEEAAEQLRNAAADTANLTMSADRADARRKIAEGFTRLAAIERGLPDWQGAEGEDREMMTR